MTKTNVFICKFKNEKCKIPLESGKQIADGLCCFHYKITCLQCKYLKKMCICEENSENSDDSILSDNDYYINEKDEKEKDDDLDFESKFNNLSEIVAKFLINIECNSLDEANNLFNSYKEDKNEFINLFYENNIYSKEHFFNYINKNIDIDDVITDYNLSLNKKDDNIYDYYKNHIMYDSLYNKNIVHKLKPVNKICICGISDGKCLDCYPNNNEIIRPPKVTMNNAFYEYYYYKSLFNKKDDGNKNNIFSNLANHIKKKRSFFKKGFE